MTTEIVATILTGAGVLVGVWRMLAHYETRNDAAHAELGRRIDGVRTELGGRIDRTNDRMDELRADVNGRIDELRADVNGRIDLVYQELVKGRS